MGGEDPDDTWYDANSFINNLSKAREFRGTYPGEAGPPVQLRKWLEAEQKMKHCNRYRRIFWL